MKVKEDIKMSRVCAVSGKGPLSGNKRSQNIKNFEETKRYLILDN